MTSLRNFIIVECNKSCLHIRLHWFSCSSFQDKYAQLIIQEIDTSVEIYMHSYIYTFLINFIQILHIPPLLLLPILLLLLTSIPLSLLLAPFLFLPLLSYISYCFCSAWSYYRKLHLFLRELLWILLLCIFFFVIFSSLYSTSLYCCCSWLSSFSYSILHISLPPLPPANLLHRIRHIRRTLFPLSGGSSTG